MLESQRSTPRESSIPHDRKACIDKLDSETGEYLIYKWQARNILQFLDMNSIVGIEKKFQVSKVLTLEDFVHLILGVIPHSEEDIVYITAGAISLFREVIKQRRDRTNHTGILWAEFTEYLLETAFNSQSMLDLPATKLIQEGQDIEDNTPLVYGAKESFISRIRLSNRHLDKQHHEKGIRQATVATGTEFILTLDQTSAVLKLYKQTSALVRKIRPSKEHHAFDSMILDFAWSEKELRVGAVFQDYTISFWDMLDKFSFEKCLNTTKYMELLQTKVWYVDSGAWLTTDKSNGFYEWSLETENCIKWPIRHEGQIITLISLNKNRIASSALDRCIIIWDLGIRNSISVLVLSDVSAHTLVYSSDFSLLLSAGFERTVLVWKLEGNRECNMFNKLEGHTHTISALTVIKTTPIAITSDDAGFIKAWDIRTFRCLQTLNMDRMEINRILPVPSLNTFIVVGNRLYWFEYSSVSSMNANGVNNSSVIPTGILYYKIDREFIIITTTDIRVIDAYTGKTNRIVADIASLGVEVTKAVLIKGDLKVLVGNPKGEIREIQHSNGLTIESTQMHSEEIIGIEYSPTLKLIVTGGYDNTIKIWKQESYHEPIKTLINVHATSLSYFSCSFEQGLMVSCSDEGTLGLWDLYLLTMKSCMKMTAEVSCLKILQKIPVMIVCENNGWVSIWNISNLDMLHSPMYVIDLSELNMLNDCVVKISYLTNDPSPPGSLFITRQSENTLTSYNVCMGTELGNACLLDLSDLFKSLKPTQKISKIYIYRSIHSNGIEFFPMLRISCASPKDITSSPKLPLNYFIKSWKAHTERLRDIVMMKISQNLIVTIGEDSYMRVWNDRGNLVAALQLSEPAPDLWNLRINTFGHRERIYSQAEIVLKKLNSRYEAEALEGKNPQIESVVNITELTDFRCSSSNTRRVIRKSTSKKAYVSLREMDTKRKATDSFKQLFNTQKYDDQAQDYCISPMGSSSGNETIKDPETKAAKQLSKKLKQIEMNKEESYKRNDSKINLNKKSEQTYQENNKKQREERRKNFIDTSRSRSVPLFKRKKVSKTSIQPAKGFCVPLIRELNQEVKRAKNNQGLSEHLTSSKSLIPSSTRPLDPKQRKNTSSVSRLPGISNEIASSILIRVMQDRVLPNGAKSVIKFY